MYKLISYIHTETMPSWPGNPSLRIEPYSAIAKGDAANTFVIHAHNHGGTHFDAPAHYISGGKTISELLPETFIYERPLLLDTPKTDREKITAEDVRAHEKELAKCDLLMLRTGFSKYRAAEPERYGAEGPALASDLAEYLVSRFWNIKAVAVDFVSIASYRDQEDGNKTHKILLGGRDGHFICAIEDVNLAPVAAHRLKKVFALPFFVAGVDSAPITVIAEET
jgi:kynurenine formamidase